MAAKWNPPSGDNITERYLAGESGPGIAKDFGVNTYTIYRLLVRRGIRLRSFSEASRLWLASETREQQIRRLTPAWTANRGGTMSDEAMRARAKALQFTQAQISSDEIIIGRWLNEKGLKPIPQFPIDRYNIDFAILPIAVEILSDKGSPFSRPPDRRKIEYLTNAGMWVLYVWITKKFPADRNAIMDNVIAFREEAQANPSAIGKYRVIRGSGELVAEGSGDFDQITAVPAARHGNWKRV